MRDLRDHLIFPGLVNAHDHLHLNNFPPLPSGTPFPNSYAWMEAFQSYFHTPEIMAAQAVPLALRCWQGALKNLFCGATTVAHHDPWFPVYDDPAFPVRLLRRFGWSHSLGLGQEDSVYTSLRYGPPVCTSFRSTPKEQPWIIHLAEGTDAIAAGELTELAALGCLHSNTVLVHGVGMTDMDKERVIANGASVVWCPNANFALLGQTLAPDRLCAAGRLMLGSDSRISGSQDLLDDLQTAACCSALSPAVLLGLVTTNGSRLLRMPEIGGLAPGQFADLLIVRDTGSDPQAALLGLRRADVRAVIRGGAPAIADPDFADWFAACQVETVPVTLDGRPKLCARTLLGPPEVAALEPGLERSDSR
jgi:cytosine/adenosine deaminase-related metal-dependent hydrolase